MANMHVRSERLVCSARPPQSIEDTMLSFYATSLLAFGERMLDVVVEKALDLLTARPERPLRAHHVLTIWLGFDPPRQARQPGI
jgi:hypothetical protein